VAQTALGSDSTSFLVDSNPPAITFGTPAANAAVEQGQSNAPTGFTCADAGIGVQSCTGPATFDAASLGFHTFAVTATDKLGHSTTQTVSYAVLKIATPADGATFPRGVAVTSSFSCGTLTAGTTCTATVTRLTPAPAGSPTAITSGQPLPTGTVGTYAVAVTIADAAGHRATLTHTYTVVQSVAGQLLLTRSNRIWVVNPDGTGLRQLTGTRTDPGAAFDDQAAKSPDGTKVVFARRATASAASQLWAIDADGSNPRQLTSGAGDNTAPAWSPDGQRIAFSSTRTGSKGYDVWAGSWNAALANPLFNLVNVTNIAGDDASPAWSPTSIDKIAFSTNRNKAQFEIYTMTTTGASQTRLTNDPHTDREPAWSPDGSKISFSSDRVTGTATFEIYVMGAANGTSQVRLTTINGDDTAPYWLDNGSIVFSSAQLGGGGLAKVPAAGGASAKVPSTLAGDANAG
jgi:dipeptidyl aminopeptidase/acylaminoacyl peptidase